jgi:hypothetical protein
MKIRLATAGGDASSVSRLGFFERRLAACSQSAESHIRDAFIVAECGEDDEQRGKWARAAPL